MQSSQAHIYFLWYGVQGLTDPTIKCIEQLHRYMRREVAHVARAEYRTHGVHSHVIQVEIRSFLVLPCLAAQQLQVASRHSRKPSVHFCLQRKFGCLSVWELEFDSLSLSSSAHLKDNRRVSTV